MPPTERVCLSEIGTLGYYYHGRVLDGLGLVSPEVLRYHPNALRSNPLYGICWGAPKSEAITNVAASFRRTFRPYSLTLLRIHATP